MKDKITFENTDYIVLAINFSLILASCLYVIVNYSDLPETIPSHFNHLGEVDGYQNKSILWILLALFTSLNIGVFFLARKTSFHNAQLRTKLANYRSLSVMMPFLSCIQFVIVYSMIETAKGTFQFSKWILPFIITLTVLSLSVMFTIIYKNKK